MDARVSYAQRRHIFVQHFRRAWLIILFGVALFIVGTLVLFLTEVSSFDSNAIMRFMRLFSYFYQLPRWLFIAN